MHINYLELFLRSIVFVSFATLFVNWLAKYDFFWEEVEVEEED
jgi:hypothetical protein